MANLFELTNEWLTLWDMADDPDVDEDMLLDTLEGVECEFETKADNYARLMKNIDSTAKMLEDEIKRLQAKKKTLENRSKWFKKNLETAMVAAGKPKFKTDLFSFSIQKNPASLKLAEDLDIADVPEDFIKYAEPEVDTAKVKDALKYGKKFSWAELVQTESLRIR